MRKRHEKTELGSDDVFVDPGFANAGECKLRVQLAMRLNGLIKDCGLTQTQAAAIFGIMQPHVSELANFKLSRFSSERLLHFMTCLDRDIEIVIRPKVKGHHSGLVSVSGA